MEKISYALGVSLGNNLKNSGFTGLDYQKLSDGIKHVIQDEKLEMSIQKAQAIINDYFQKLQEKAFEQNIQEGKNFLAENAKRAAVKTTASGLQYEVIKEGKGEKPTADDRVTVHYHGTLLNGEVFDSSVNRGEPATFGVTQVIRGWVEALQLMPVGSKWKLYIPSDLAYGAQGAGQSIAPHTTLIFEVELLDIV
ncbi:MAG: FKBP-type peptidyl-prolyl cis-trans isomerase [Paludibacter sp.]|nr:FKBP-type peptidyl-prolyl cis-trans isomerase [Paludibacter sp.]MDD4199434.1 FKBP-type peptidyl-prolyl cis-trans isomerase [Paludibacter sp.]